MGILPPVIASVAPSRWVIYACLAANARDECSTEISGSIRDAGLESGVAFLFKLKSFLGLLFTDMTPNDPIVRRSICCLVV
jgi:hypothetical protein